MRLSDGGLTLRCVRRCWAHLACHALWRLAPKRLQRPSNFSEGSYLLGRLVSRGFCGLVWHRQRSKSAPRPGAGIAAVPAS